MTQATATPATKEVVVSDEDRFLFDMQGFLILRGALAEQDRVALLDALIEQEEREHDDSGWLRPTRNGKPSDPTKIVEPGFVRLNGILRTSPAFDQAIDYPTVLPYLKAFMNGPQIGHAWSITRTKGGPAGTWHRGRSPQHYTVRDGRINCAMLNTVYALTDNGPGDGGMAVIPGGHKCNFDLPFKNYPELAMPGAVAVHLRAGDVLIFCESLLHTGLAKTTEGRRSNLYFNYNSAEFSILTYSPQHNHHFVMPPRIRDRFTPQQQQLSEWMAYAQWDD